MFNAANHILQQVLSIVRFVLICTKLLIGNLIMLFFGTLTQDSAQLLMKHHSFTWIMLQLFNTLAHSKLIDNISIIISLAEVELTANKASDILNDLKKPERFTEDYFYSTLAKHYPDKPSIGYKHILNNQQSNHFNAVSYSIVKSIMSLRARYSQVPYSQIKDQVIEALSKHSDQGIDRQMVIQALEMIENNQIEHQHLLNNHQCHIDLKQCASLVWQGIIDKSPSTNPLNYELSDNDIDLRILTFLRECQKIAETKCFSADETEHEVYDLCFTGIFNDLIGTLDKCHEDVSVDACIHSAVVPNELTRWVKEKLESCQEPEKNIILEEWFETDSKTRDDWIKKIQPSCQQHLRQLFTPYFKEYEIDHYSNSESISCINLERNEGQRLTC